MLLFWLLNFKMSAGYCLMNAPHSCGVILLWISFLFSSLFKWYLGTSDIIWMSHEACMVTQRVDKGFGAVNLRKVFFGWGLFIEGVALLGNNYLIALMHLIICVVLLSKDFYNNKNGALLWRSGILLIQYIFRSFFCSAFSTGCCVCVFFLTYCSVTCILCISALLDKSTSPAGNGMLTNQERIQQSKFPCFIIHISWLGFANYCYNIFRVGKWVKFLCCRIHVSCLGILEIIARIF